LSNYPGIQLFAWVPVVPNDQVEIYQRRAEDDGLGGVFSFAEITGFGKRV
ncbi:MAG: hypothetical protein GWN87_22720, partial [Desulfuromonadales bacterium]|nr:hypothetical protein [Desulfuromonadales bacterium]NIS42301.1 hypothetical protein [Desulfuromonadales bacterium]